MAQSEVTNVFVHGPKTTKPRLSIWEMGFQSSFHGILCIETMLSGLIPVFKSLLRLLDPLTCYYLENFKYLWPYIIINKKKQEKPLPFCLTAARFGAMKKSRCWWSKTMHPGTGVDRQGFPAKSGKIYSPPAGWYKKFLYNFLGSNLDLWFKLS